MAGNAGTRPGADHAGRPTRWRLAGRLVVEGLTASLAGRLVVAALGGGLAAVLVAALLRSA